MRLTMRGGAYVILLVGLTCTNRIYSGLERVLGGQLLHTAGPLILMAEDNPEDVYLINESLREAGVQARLLVVSDGDSAIRHVLEVDERPALVLLDAHLPKKNGIEVLEAIRASDAGKEIPIVIFSSEISELEQSQADGLGVSAYLSKSSDLAEFNRIGPLIKQLLKQAAAKSQPVDF